MSEGQRASTAADYQQRILRVLVHIQTHLDEAISLEELARLACFSPFHFHRIFSGMTGEGVMEHVRRLRLERAAHRLRFGEGQIVRLAFEAGFETHEAFSRAFKVMFGISPTEFRAARCKTVFPRAANEIHYVDDGQLNSFAPLQGDGPMQVKIENIAKQRVAFVRHSGPYEKVGDTWSKLMSWAWPRGLVGPSTQPFALSYDDPQVTPPDKLRYHACIPVGANVSGEGDIGVQEVAGGQYAVADHIGPYEQLHDTYARLFGQWLPGSGRTPRTDPCIERYLNDPRSTPPDKLHTQVCIPLA